MRKRYVVGAALIATVAAASCGETTRPSDITSPNGRRAALSGTVEESEWIAEGRPTAEFWEYPVSAYFYSGRTIWKTIFFAHYKVMTDLSVTNTSKILDGTSGAVLNSGTKGLGLLSETYTFAGDSTLTVSLSTGSRRCDMIGKGQLTGHARSFLTVGGVITTTFLNATVDDPATDYTILPCKPTPHFTMSGTSAYGTEGDDMYLDAGQYVNFDGSGSVAADYDITSYAWDVDGSSFGGNTTNPGRYFEPGAFTVSLTVSDDYGDSDVASAEISVADTDEVNNGGGGGVEDCYDVFIVWDNGTETYWYSFCCDGGGHCYES